MRRSLRALLAGLALASLCVGQAEAQARDANNPTCPPISTMKFADLNRMSFTLDTSTGRRILVADGGIAFGTHALLEKALADNQPLDELVIRSPGGLAEEGMKMGRVIRDAGLPTRIPSGFWCASACSFVFLGGAVRTVDEGGVYAVHMFTNVTEQRARGDLMGESKLMSDMAAVEQTSAQIASEENDFMIRMGASRKLLTEVMYRQKSLAMGAADRSTLRCLTQDELRRYNVVNVADAPEAQARP